MALGYPHPDLLLQQLTSLQWNELIAYYQIEPFGEFRSELRNGKLMALMANMKRDAEKKPEPFAPVDFMSFVDRPEERPLTPEEIEQQLSRIFGA